MRAYVPYYLAVDYLLFATAAALGVLQAAAVASGDRRLAAFVSLDHPGRGYAVAGAWIAGAYASYWFLAPELLTPGPAGAELTTLFGLSVLLALGLARWLAWSRRAASDERPAAKDPGGRFAQSRAWRGISSRAWRGAFCIIPRLLGGVLLSAVVGVYDLPLFRSLNGLAGRWPAFDATLQFLMNDYMVPTALVLTLLGLWFAGRTPAERTANRSTALRALLALIVASVVLRLANVVYFRPRPFTSHEVTLLFYHPSDSSFPSNAATVGFALAVAVWLHRRRWGAWMLALASAMGLARVMGGVHFPLDVVAGAWLGGLSAWAVHRAAWLAGALERVVRLAQQLALGIFKA